MYAAQMMFSSMLVVLPILVVLFLIYIGLLVYTFRLGRNDKNRSIGWRFVRLSLLISIPSAYLDWHCVLSAYVRVSR